MGGTTIIRQYANAPYNEEYDTSSGGLTSHTKVTDGFWCPFCFDNLCKYSWVEYLKKCPHCKKHYAELKYNYQDRIIAIMKLR